MRSFPTCQTLNARPQCTLLAPDNSFWCQKNFFGKSLGASSLHCFFNCSRCRCLLTRALAVCLVIGGHDPCKVESKDDSYGDDDDGHCGTACEDPAHRFDFPSGIRDEYHVDFVVEFFDLQKVSDRSNGCRNK